MSIEFLMLTLHAPLSAFGSPKSGFGGTAQRRSALAPTKSQVLGLLACALGVGRDDVDWHRAAASAYSLAVREDCAGQAMLDYHTSQSYPGKPARTLKDAQENCAEKAVVTTVSMREWRADAFHTAAVWVSGASKPPAALSACAAATNSPLHILFNGRKSGAFGLPLRAEVIVADGVRNAFTQRKLNSMEHEVLCAVRKSQGRVRRDVALYCEDGAVGAPPPIESRLAGDVALSRRRAMRSFGSRIVHESRIAAAEVA